MKGRSALFPIAAPLCLSLATACMAQAQFMAETGDGPLMVCEVVSSVGTQRVNTASTSIGEPSDFYAGTPFRLERKGTSYIVINDDHGRGMAINDLSVVSNTQDVINFQRVNEDSILTYSFNRRTRLMIRMSIAHTRTDERTRFSTRSTIYTAECQVLE